VISVDTDWLSNNTIFIIRIFIGCDTTYCDIYRYRLAVKTRPFLLYESSLAVILRTELDEMSIFVRNW
jgi:hypothetical protein